MKDINVLLDDETYAYLKAYGDLVADVSVSELIVSLCTLFRFQLEKGD